MTRPVARGMGKMVATEHEPSLIDNFQWVLKNVVGTDVVEIFQVGEDLHTLYLRVDLRLPKNAKEMLASLKYEQELLNFEARLKASAWAESPPIQQEDDQFLKFAVSFVSETQSYLVGYWTCEANGSSDVGGDFLADQFDEVGTIYDVDSWWTEMTGHDETDEDTAIALTDFAFVEFLEDEDHPAENERASVQSEVNAVE